MHPLRLVWDLAMEADSCAHEWGLRALQELEAEEGPRELAQAAATPHPPVGTLAPAPQNSAHAPSQQSVP